MDQYQHQYQYHVQLERFTRYLQAKGRRDSTVHHYRGEARRFLRWVYASGHREAAPADGATCAAEGAAAETTPFSAHWAREFLLSIADTRGRSAAQYNISYQAVLQFTAFVCGVEVASLGLDLRPQRVPAAARRVLSEDAVQRLLQAVHHPRYRLMLTLQYAAGLRLHEVRHLRVEQLSRMADGGVMLALTETKGAVPRQVRVGPAMGQQLRAWYRRYRPTQWYFTANDAPHGAVVASGSVQEALHRAKALAKLSFTGATHQLRHAFAHHQLRAGCDIRSLQAALGHTDLHTTVKYLQDLDVLGHQRTPVVDLIQAWGQEAGA